MKLNKSLAVAGAVATIGLASVAGIGAASAQTSSSTSGVSGLVDKIAQKFNLKASDVQAVFDEDKTAREAQRQTEISNRLQTAVDNKKITAEQKTLIENKLKELQSARKTERTELESWATKNNVAMKYVMVHGRHGDSDSRLQDAVNAGEITAAQKTLIETKQKELETKREANRTSIEQWASDNNIDDTYIMMGGHGGPKGGMRPF